MPALSKLAAPPSAVAIPVLRVVAVLLAAAVACAGLDWRSPALASARPSVLFLLLAGSASLMLLALRGLGARAARASAPSRLLALATLVLAATGGIAALAAESRFGQLRAEVLAADRAALERLGRHLIVGYRDRAEIQRLIEARAVGGVFITTRNVSSRKAADIAAEVAGWQAIRRGQGLPPLIIATDQEGGDVSRLSPPLDRLPSLAAAVAKAHASEGRRAVAFDYGRRQGADLSRLGVTLNLAPVVDLNFDVRSSADAHTRIWRRAIHREPAVVAETADAYCQGLAEAGVSCTLKHFPGLGRLAKDTHVTEARLELPVAVLEGTDWVPFRSGRRPSSTYLMLGHVRLTAVDPDRPASLSRKVVAGIIRGDWKYDGVLITDDLSMRAAYAGEPAWGLGAAGSAAVSALNAGVDLLLVSFDTDQVYSVLSALLLAERDGRLDSAALAESARRLDRP